MLKPEGDNFSATLTKKNIGSLALLIFGGVGSILLARYFLDLRNIEVSTGIVILFPSLAYSHVSASVGNLAKVSRFLAWVIRMLILVLAIWFLLYLGGTIPQLTIGCLISIAGVLYCFLVDVTNA